MAICLMAIFLLFGMHIKRRNEQMALQLKIPQVEKELGRLEQENAFLKVEIQQFEEPSRLLELSQQPQFGHLKYVEENL